jgi:hypothetical protein
MTPPSVSATALHLHELHNSLLLLLLLLLLPAGQWQGQNGG